MTHDVTQWLAEIQTLKQQLMELQRDREEAHASATNWRRLYETEAQQRRAEASLAQQTIDGLTLELQQIKGFTQLGSRQPEMLEVIRAEVEPIQSIAELQERLVAALSDRDRLMDALKLEQANHAQTRKSLTTALGDAIGYQFKPGQ
jgi:hypothetical protein